MRTVFMGSPAFGLPTLRGLRSAGHSVDLVVTQPDRAAGRSRRLTPPPVAAYAREEGLPLYQPERLRGEGALDPIRAVEPELIVVAAFGLILPSSLLGLPPLGCLNVHPSLLPHHRGPAPIQGALLAGDAVTGTSIILLEERMDAGPILAQEPTPIAPDDDAETLEPRLAEQGARLLVTTLPRWAAREIEPIVQDEAAATYTHLISKEEGRLDWTRPAAALWRQVRAFAGWPGAYTTWRGQPLKVLRASPEPERPADLAPGTVYWVAEGRPSAGVAVAAGDGGLRLDTIALAGKRPTAGTAFIQGYRDFVGSTLGA